MSTGTLAGPVHSTGTLPHVSACQSCGLVLRPEQTLIGVKTGDPVCAGCAARQASSLDLENVSHAYFGGLEEFAIRYLPPVVLLAVLCLYLLFHGK